MKLRPEKTASKNHTSTHPYLDGLEDEDEDGVAQVDTVEVREPAIDKLAAAVLNEDLREGDKAAILERAQHQLRDRVLIRGSAKGEQFNRVFIQKTPSGAVIKYAMEPNRPDHHSQFMQITLNPNLMEPADVVAFGAMIQTLFGPQWRRRMKALKYSRLDACVDVKGVFANDLIVMFDGSRVQGLFFIQVDRQGRVQTIYCGSVSSETHGCVYDQVASDAFKMQVGEKVPQPQMQRVKAGENAEVAIVNLPKQGRTRFEVRNVIKPMLSLADLAKMESAMHRFTVYEIRKKPGVKFDSQFRLYLDSVRMRGISGARVNLTEFATKNKKKVDSKVLEMESRLGKLAAVWWEPEQFVLDVCAVLQRHGLWDVLNPK